MWKGRGDLPGVVIAQGLSRRCQSTFMKKAVFLTFDWTDEMFFLTKSTNAVPNHPFE